jgi:hypothetical protein
MLLFFIFQQLQAVFSDPGKIFCLTNGFFNQRTVQLWAYVCMLELIAQAEDSL